MNCPACGKMMVILEYKAVELDFCPACGGCWLDSGELELVVGCEGLPVDWAGALPKKSSRRCFRCGRKMRAGPLPGSSVEIDACRDGHGLWLDKGELKAVAAARGASGATNAVLQFCSEVFGEES